MADIHAGSVVTVHHPSPLSWIPARGRKVRHGYERIATAARTRAVPDDAFVPVIRNGPEDLAADFYQLDAFAFEGAVFVPVTGYHGPVGPDAFLARISSPDPSPAGFRLTSVTDGTPLAARIARTYRTSQADGVDEGADLAAIAPKSVLFQDREVAAAALRRYLSENLVLTPTRVMHRFAPLAEVRLQYGESDAFLRMDHNFSVGHPPLVRPDRLGDVWSAYGGSHHTPLTESDAGAIATRFPAALIGDDDLVSLANALPDVAVALADAAMATASVRSRVGRYEAVSEARDGMVRWALRGRMGAIAGPAVPFALESSLALLRTVEANASCRIDYLGQDFQAVPNLMRYVEDFALVRLGARIDAESQADDALALGSLAP